jgi:hypothetical protein
VVPAGEEVQGGGQDPETDPSAEAVADGDRLAAVRRGEDQVVAHGLPGEGGQDAEADEGEDGDHRGAAAHPLDRDQEVRGDARGLQVLDEIDPGEEAGIPDDGPDALAGVLDGVGGHADHRVEAVGLHQGPLVRGQPGWELHRAAGSQEEGETDDRGHAPEEAHGFIVSKTLGRLRNTGAAADV